MVLKKWFADLPPAFGDALTLFTGLGLLPWAPLVAGFLFGWRWEFLLPCAFWGLSWWGAVAAALGRTGRAGGGT